MSSPKLIAYKAIIEMTSMMSEFMKNPDIISKYAEEAAKSVAMSDAEIQKRNEALEIIKNAEIESKKIEEKKREFQDKSDIINKHLNNRKIELDKFQLELNNLNQDINKKHDEALKIHEDAKKKINEASDVLDAAIGKENNHKKDLENFSIEKNKFSNEKQIADERLKNIIIRENAIAEFSGKLKV